MYPTHKKPGWIVLAYYSFRLLIEKMKHLAIHYHLQDYLLSEGVSIDLDIKKPGWVVLAYYSFGLLIERSIMTPYHNKLYYSHSIVADGFGDIS